MTDRDNRKTPRIGSHNLISYVCLDDDGKQVMQGMGRTLNISEGGILLETHVPIDPKYIVSFTINFEDEMMDIKGRVTYNKKSDERYEAGIQFIDIDKSKTEILKQFAIMFKDEINK
jgi:hypothetical protein